MHEESHTIFTLVLRALPQRSPQACRGLSWPATPGDPRAARSGSSERGDDLDLGRRRGDAGDGNARLLGLDLVHDPVEPREAAGHAHRRGGEDDEGDAEGGGGVEEAGHVGPPCICTGLCVDPERPAITGLHSIS